MTEMYIQYGSYAHAPGEANLINFIARPLRSARGVQEKVVVEAHVSGQVKANPGDDEYDVANKVQAIENAVSRDGRDWGLYHSDGSPTPHILYTNDSFSLTGNQIVHRMFPSSHNGEFSTGRDFSYVVRNTFRATDSNILDYQESIGYIGTTGPKVVWKENKYLPAYYEVDSFRSLQTIKQTGYAITNGTYLIPPPPILPPPFELQHLRGIRRTSPRRWSQGVEGFRIEWNYTFNVPQIFGAFPSIR